MQVSLPFGFSPTASQKLAHPEGELATSRAAAKFGLGMGLSSYSNHPLEDVAAQGVGNPYVMQMCVLRDRSITEQLLQRAESMSIVISRQEYRNFDKLQRQDSRPCSYRLTSLFLGSDSTNTAITTSSQRTYPGQIFSAVGVTHRIVPITVSAPVDFCMKLTITDPSLDWESAIPWIRQHTSLQIWLKGGNHIARLPTTVITNGQFAPPKTSN